MSAWMVLAAVVSALGPRPASLTGGKPAAYAGWLHARVQTADRAFGAEACPTAQIRSISGRALGSGEMAPVHVLRGSGAPAYLERVRLTGCGRETTHNIQVVRLRRGGWDGIGLLPGDPRSTPRQQNEAMQQMAAVALNTGPALPCPSSQALRTMVHGEARVIASHGTGWTERWPLRLCGVDRSVDVRFEAPGGAARITPASSR